MLYGALNANEIFAFPHVSVALFVIFISQLGQCQHLGVADVALADSAKSC